MAKHYANKKKTQTSDFFDSFSDDTWSGHSLKHYKEIVLQKMEEDSDPNDRHIREWTEPWIQPKRLLKDMEREGLIKIEYINYKGCIKRVLTKK